MQAISHCYDTPDCVSQFQFYHEPCPGKYCGRHFIDGSTVSDCGACPAGTRSDSWMCIPCGDAVDLYDIIFFLIVIPALFIGIYLFHRSARKSLASHVRSTIPKSQFRALMILEIIISVVAAIFLVDPIGEFKMHVCTPSEPSLTDWFPFVANPPGAHCASEAVFPRYTFPIVMITVNTVLALTLRMAWLEGRRRLASKWERYTYDELEKMEVQPLFVGVAMAAVYMLCSAVIYNGLFYFFYLIFGIACLAQLWFFRKSLFSRAYKAKTWMPPVLLAVSWLLARLLHMIRIKAARGDFWSLTYGFYPGIFILSVRLLRHLMNKYLN